MKFLKLPSSRLYIERSQKRKKKFLESSSLHLIYRRKEKLSREHIQKEEKKFPPEKNQKGNSFSQLYIVNKKEKFEREIFQKNFPSGIYIEKKKEIRKVSFLLYIEEEQKDFLSSFADSLPSIVNRKSFSEAQQDLPTSGATRKENFLRILSKKTRKTS